MIDMARLHQHLADDFTGDECQLESLTVDSKTGRTTLIVLLVIEKVVVCRCELSDWYYADVSAKKDVQFIRVKDADEATDTVGVLVSPESSALLAVMMR